MPLMEASSASLERYSLSSYSSAASLGCFLASYLHSDDKDTGMHSIAFGGVLRQLLVLRVATLPNRR